MTGDSEPPAPRRRLRRLGVGLAALLVGGFIALLVIGLSAGKLDRSIDDAIARGELEPAPDFSLPVIANGGAVGTREGATLSLSDLRGRPVVLNFWASWCEPCRSEAPIMEAAWRDARDRGAVVLGIDVQDLTENAQRFIADHRQTYPHVRDKTDETYNDYGLTGLPETFFIDRAGRVRIHWVGEIDAQQVADGLDVVLPAASP